MGVTARRSRNQIPGLDLASKEIFLDRHLVRSIQLPSIGQISRQGRPKHETRNPKFASLRLTRLWRCQRRATLLHQEEERIYLLIPKYYLPLPWWERVGGRGQKVSRRIISPGWEGLHLQAKSLEQRPAQPIPCPAVLPA